MKNLNKNEWIAVCVGLVVVIYVFFFAQNKTPIGNMEEVDQSQEEMQYDDSQTENNQAKQINNQQTKNNMEELQIKTIKEGTGEPITVGQTAEVNYTGKLVDGTVFDSSIPRGQTFEFRLGEGSVIAGWEEGVKGMKVGEKRELTIPGNMAYGSRGVPNGQGGYVIPPNATLVFEVDLVSIK